MKLAAFALTTCLAAATLATLAAAAGDEKAAAEALLKEVEASPRKDVASELVTRARAALDRSAKLRASGDEAHAKLADAAAKTWAEAARDVTRATVVEEKAAATRIAATDAGVLAERERALLEEAIAQAGRVRAQLETAERDRKEEPARTNAAAATADAGARTPPKAPPAARDGGAR